MEQTISRGAVAFVRKDEADNEPGFRIEQYPKIISDAHNFDKGFIGMPLIRTKI